MCFILELCTGRVSEYCWWLLWYNAGSYTVCVNKNLHAMIKIHVKYKLILSNYDFSCLSFINKSSASAEVADRNVTWYVL